MEKIVEELIKGRDWVKELQALIQNPSGDDVAVLQQKELSDKIFGSLSKAISVMKSGPCEYSGEVCKSPAIVTTSFGDLRSLGSGQSCKRPAAKDRRGGYKRRKSSDSWIKVSSTMVDDYAWRKYGQKEIINATFPRCYFRCTHKHDQGCKATKQVQRIQEEPKKYQITYFGNHTCENTLQPNLEKIILDSYSQGSNLINFESNTPSDMYPSPSCPDSIKEEKKELEVQSDLNSVGFPPLDSITWSELTPLMSSDITEDFLPGVYSYVSLIGSHGMDMDFFSKCNDFERSFHLTE